MESQPQNPEFRNNPEKLSPMRMVCIILVEGIVRNICVKLFCIWASG